MLNFESGAGTNAAGFRRLRRESEESRGENFLDGLRCCGRVNQLGGPLRKNACNPVMMFLGDELIQPRVSFSEQGVEWNLSPVLGVEMKPRFVLTA